MQPPPVNDGGNANVVHVEERLVNPPFAEYLEPDLGPKSFGPKAVFTKGELGNYERPVRTRSGPGEDGLPVLTTMEEKDKADRSIREFGFNMVASDKIAMNRTIPDMRMAECKYWRYPQV